MRRTLVEAKLARRRRKQRLAELRSRWADPVPVPEAKKPMLMGDVLRQLDQLLGAHGRPGAARQGLAPYSSASGWWLSTSERSRSSSTCV